jgi:FkbM family methyltransferase
MSAENPAAPPPAPRGKLRRRDVVAGGLVGLAGLGGAAAGWYTAPRRLPPGASASYSQSGEDMILAMMLTYYNIKSPTYMDIGSADPIENSNTYLLYSTWGARGLLVEPNPALSGRIRSARPGDTLLAAGIGLSDATEADYYMFDKFELNTFDPAQKDRLLRDERDLKLERTVKVPLVNINRAIAEHLGGRAPDVLSIDIEGLDLPVLRTLDFAKYRPRIVVAETLVTLTHNHNPETTPFMASHGYEVRGMTYPNTIYVDRKLLK